MEIIKGDQGVFLALSIPKTTCDKCQDANNYFKLFQKNLSIDALRRQSKRSFEGFYVSEYILFVELCS
jgi:hypothetical protein